MTEINDRTVETIMHCKKSVLFSNNEIWTKKHGEDFDVSMGSYDGAEVCELVGLYLLSHITEITGKEFVALYRDDGLAVSPSTSGPNADNLRKRIVKVFQKNHLNVTIEANMIQTDFLDINLNLSRGKYWPYRKPNNNPIYIDSQSNHPPNIKKHLPNMIASRISHNACSGEQFLKAAPLYQDALKNSHSDSQLVYQPPEKKSKKRNRKRNILCFNLPYNEQVCTNVGKKFLNLIDKHFPPHSKLHRLFNRKDIKVSYSCTPNVRSIINWHSKSILRNHNEVKNLSPSLNHCNFRNKANCPLKGKCCVSSVICKAVLSTGEAKKLTMEVVPPPSRQETIITLTCFEILGNAMQPNFQRQCGNARTTTKRHQSHGPS